MALMALVAGEWIGKCHLMMTRILTMSTMHSSGVEEEEGEGDERRGYDRPKRVRVDEK